MHIYITIKSIVMAIALDARLIILFTAVIIITFHLINVFLMVPAIAHVLKKAGRNFVVLGEEERCHGDVARRAGNEYLGFRLKRLC